MSFLEADKVSHTRVRKLASVAKFLLDSLCETRVFIVVITAVYYIGVRGNIAVGL